MSTIVSTNHYVGVKLQCADHCGIISNASVVLELMFVYLQHIMVLLFCCLCGILAKS